MQVFGMNLFEMDWGVLSWLLSEKKVSYELMSGQPAFWGLHGSSVWVLGFVVGIG